jgi:hypothetical protein
MLDPRSIMVALPCGDGRVMAETMGMLVSAKNMYGAISTVNECSLTQLARNVIAERFLQSPYEWLVSIDSDIVPTPEDFGFLLEPCDMSARYWEPGKDDADVPPGALPRPSRVITSQLNAPGPGQPLDFNSRTAGAADMLVVAEYSYKNDTLEPVKFGFGFVRVHRSVFERLQAMEHPKNPLSQEYDKIIETLKGGKENGEISEYLSDRDLEVLQRCRPDPGGGPRLWQGSYKGKIIYDYFPCGPQISTFLPQAQWKGEDHGFFMLCHMAGIMPRIETRTRLTHIGRKGYPYMGPDYGGGQ